MSYEKIDAAIQEVKAQLELLETIQKVPGRLERERVMLAVKHILEADALVPGIFAALAKGLQR
jgi:hypothetical protein